MCVFRKYHMPIIFVIIYSIRFILKVRFRSKLKILIKMCVCVCVRVFKIIQYEHNAPTKKKRTCIYTKQTHVDLEMVAQEMIPAQRRVWCDAGSAA